jgi:hypothetical protein
MEKVLVAVVDATASAGYGIHHFTAATTTTGWSSNNICYKYVAPPAGPDTPSPAAIVAAVSVSFANRKVFFPPSDIVLLPILSGIAPGGGINTPYKGGADAVDGAVET